MVDSVAVMFNILALYGFFSFLAYAYFSCPRACQQRRGELVSVLSVIMSPDLEIQLSWEMMSFLEDVSVRTKKISFRGETPIKNSNIKKKSRK